MTITQVPNYWVTTMTQTPTNESLIDLCYDTDLVPNYQLQTIMLQQGGYQQKSYDNYSSKGFAPYTKLSCYNYHITTMKQSPKNVMTITQVSNYQVTTR